MVGTERTAVMDALTRLVQADPRSEIVRTARRGLVGLRAQLDDAVRSSPDDSAVTEGKQLIGEIDTVLAGAAQASPADWPRAAGGGPSAGVVDGSGPPHEDALRDLVTAFSSDPAVKTWLDGSSLAELLEQPEGRMPQASGAWRALNLGLLRLPEPLADQWRARVVALAAPGFAHRGGLVLPGSITATLVPARQPDEAGITVSPQMDLDGDVLASLGMASGTDRGSPGLIQVAQVASLVLAMTALDRQLVLCLESVLFKGCKRLDDKLRQRFRADFLDRLRALARCAPGTGPAFEALIEVDEAINSLSHRTPAAPGSWWGQLRQTSRRMAVRRPRI